MTKASCLWRLLEMAVVIFSGAILMAPYASADIIHVENGTACNPGGTICSGGSSSTTPFSLTDIENGTETLIDPLDPSVTVGNSTVPTYLINNDTGSTSFTFTFTGTLASNAFLTCQVTGSESCSITGSLGTVGTNGNYGPPPGGANWSPNVTITFNNVAAGDFDLTFASFAHAGTDTGTISGVPESSSLALLAAGLFGVSLIAFFQKRHGSEVAAY